MSKTTRRKWPPEAMKGEVIGRLSARAVLVLRRFFWDDEHAWRRIRSPEEASEALAYLATQAMWSIRIDKVRGCGVGSLREIFLLREEERDRLLRDISPSPRSAGQAASTKITGLAPPEAG